jgi:hypothetical protein
LNHQQIIEVRTITPNAIVCLTPSSQRPQQPVDVACTFDPAAIDLPKQIARPHPHRRGRALRVDARSFDAALRIDPHNPVVRPCRLATVNDVNQRRNRQQNCQRREGRRSRPNFTESNQEKPAEKPILIRSHTHCNSMANTSAAMRAG